MFGAPRECFPGPAVALDGPADAEVFGHIFSGVVA